MQLQKLAIQNYRLLVDAELDVDPKTTLIVGRNNTAKTSCFACIEKVLKGERFSFDDYPLSKRADLYTKIALFMEKKLSYEDLCNQMALVSVEFLVDYSLDNPDEPLGALSPFIIDIDIDSTTVLIRVEYQLKTDEKTLWSDLEKGYYPTGVFSPTDETHALIAECFSKRFGHTVYAINPKNHNDRQVKSLAELQELFPIYNIPAERVLGEDATHNSSLSSLITSFFNTNEDDLDPEVAEEIKRLRDIVYDANKKVQKQSDEILSAVVDNAIGFGYPNLEELKLGVTTHLRIDDQIKNQTMLSYVSGSEQERLPNTHNGLGYKNLIKIEFLLATFAKDVEQRGESCIPLLFIEEPESHMHPQMQTAFANHLESYLNSLSNVRIQTFITSHSAHIANTLEFSKIRYARKTKAGVIYKNLNSFTSHNPANVDFIRKYLTLTKCDLFFADKAIFVEGAAERLLLPDMIDKCVKDNVFGNDKYNLSAQYYTLIEIGGAYAHIFIPFVEFLEIPCLIITDIDSVCRRKAVSVSQGTTSSNATIKWWVRKNKGRPASDTTRIPLAEIMAMTDVKKTRGKCRIEFQTTENSLCGRSLEEAIKNVNRALYGLPATATEENIAYTGTCKTDFALDLIYNCHDYVIPAYIKSGLIWLNAQKTSE